MTDHRSIVPFELQEILDSGAPFFRSISAVRRTPALVVGPSQPLVKFCKVDHTPRDDIMNPYHMYDDSLQRAQAESGDKRKDSMLLSFKQQIEGLGQSIMGPDTKRRQMAKLMNDWIPAMERIGADKELIGNVVHKVQKSGVNDIGRLAKNFVDSFYIVRERERYAIEETNIVERVSSPGDSWVEAILYAEASVRASVGKSVLSLYKLGKCVNQEGFELQERPPNAANLRSEDLEDQDEDDWLVIPDP